MMNSKNIQNFFLSSCILMNVTFTTIDAEVTLCHVGSEVDNKSANCSKINDLKPPFTCSKVVTTVSNTAVYSCLSSDVAQSFCSTPLPGTKVNCCSNSNDCNSSQSLVSNSLLLGIFIHYGIWSFYFY